MVEFRPLLAQKGAAPGSMRKLDHHGYILWNTEYIRGLRHYAIVRDTRKKNPEKLLEKVTRQAPRTIEGEDRASQEPRGQCPQLPEWGHQELVAESVGSCHLLFRHFLRFTDKNLVVAQVDGSEAEPVWHPTLAIPHGCPEDLWDDGGCFTAFPPGAFCRQDAGGKGTAQQS